MMIIDENYRLHIQSKLKELIFVMWDRYVYEGEIVTAFGWIGRQDAYKDFVVVKFTPVGESFQTSSIQYSEVIAEALGISHSKCERIETMFNIPNVIKLKHNGEELQKGKV